MCKAKIIYAGKEIATVNLVYAESVSKNYLLYAVSLLKRLISSTVFKVIFVIALVLVIGYIALVIRSNNLKKKKKQLKLVKFNEMKPQQPKKNRHYKPKH